MSTRRTALVFDLDGTLVDSVYQHVLAWHDALLAAGIELSIWRIHRRIGMSGGLFTRALLRETGRESRPRAAAAAAAAPCRGLQRSCPGDVRPLPGAVELLRALTALGCALGHRHQRPDARPRARRSQARRARRRADRHPRHGAPRQARPRPVPGRGRPAGRRPGRACSWSATASGTCWPPAVRGRLGIGAALGRLRQGGAGARRAPIASMTTRRCC